MASAEVRRGWVVLDRAVTAGYGAVPGNTVELDRGRGVRACTWRSDA